MDTFARQQKILLSKQFVLTLIDLAKQSGVHPDKLLKGTRCFYKDLTSVNHAVTPEDFLTIIENTSNYTKRDDLSFMLGRKYFPNHLGSISQAIMNCRNLAEMLKLCQLFQFQIFPLVFFNTYKSQGRTHLVFNSAIGKVTAQQQIFIFEFVLSAMLGAFKYRFTEPLPVTIKLPFNEVEHLEQYHAHVNGQVLFSQQVAMMSFDDKWLFHETADCSESLKKIAISEARCQREELNAIGFVQAVSLFIYKNEGNVSLDDCAEHLSISVATLKRKLANNKTSYQTLLDEIRCQHAIFEITENHKNNENIAATLKFNDVTNFRKAFKRWTGMTPSAFRDNAFT